MINLVETRHVWAATKPWHGFHREPLDTASLTKSEKEVLSLIVRGAATKEIAADRSVSEQTIKNHLKKSFKKLSITRGAKELIIRFWRDSSGDFSIFSNNVEEEGT